MYTKPNHIILYLLIAVSVFMANGCSGNTATKTGDTNRADTGKRIAASKALPIKKPSVGDEQQFRDFLKAFKTAVQQNNNKQLLSMLYFPLQTQPQWTNDDLTASTINPAEGLITQSEYPQYAGVIFSKDAARLIPKSKEDDLSEIDTNTDENYYKTIGKVTDKGSTLYELQQQYQQSNGKETSYGFVFGKVNGQYKVISYYCPWPVKG